MGESAGVSHGEATLGGSGSYVKMDAINKDLKPINFLRSHSMGNWNLTILSNYSMLNAAGVLLWFLQLIKTEYLYARGVSGKVVLIVEPS